MYQQRQFEHAAIRQLSLRYLVAIAVAAGALFISAATVSAATSHASKGVVISAVKHAKLGVILVSGGRTLYSLNKNDCGKSCLVYWPAVILPKGVAKAVAGPGVSVSKLGRVKDKVGSWQVTYAGKALYWFTLDTAPGQVKGNHVKDPWGTWQVVVLGSNSALGGSATTTKAGTTTTKPVTTTTASGGGGPAF